MQVVPADGEDEGGGAAPAVPALRAQMRAFCAALRALRWLPLVEPSLSATLHAQLRQTLTARCARRWLTGWLPLEHPTQGGTPHPPTCGPEWIGVADAVLVRAPRLSGLADGVLVLAFRPPADWRVVCVCCARLTLCLPPCAASRADSSAGCSAGSARWPCPGCGSCCSLAPPRAPLTRRRCSTGTRGCASPPCRASRHCASARPSTSNPTLPPPVC